MEEGRKAKEQTPQSINVIAVSEMESSHFCKTTMPWSSLDYGECDEALQDLSFPGNTTFARISQSITVCI